LFLQIIVAQNHTMKDILECNWTADVFLFVSLFHSLHLLYLESKSSAPLPQMSTSWPCIGPF